ncbi:MAG: arginase family protein [Nanoarchaeota archaeon]
MTFVVEVPIENSFDKIGCRKAPKEIINHFPNSYFSELNKELNKEAINFKKIGEPSTDIKNMVELIKDKSKEFILSSGEAEKIVFLGGDHSLTYSTLSSFFEYCNDLDEESFLIVFDAHADCKKHTSNGENYPNNTQWLRKIIDDGFPTDRIILAGLRNLTNEENSFLVENNIRCYRMKDMFDFQEICDIIMELANKFKIYISIDIDVVDSAFVPGTANPETGGLTSRQLFYFIQRLNLLKGIKVFDIVEINPDKDINNITLDLAVKLLGEII